MSIAKLDAKKGLGNHTVRFFTISHVLAGLAVRPGNIVNMK